MKSEENEVYAIDVKVSTSEAKMRVSSFPCCFPAFLRFWQKGV